MVKLMLTYHQPTLFKENYKKPKHHSVQITLLTTHKILLPYS